LFGVERSRNNSLHGQRLGNNARNTTITPNNGAFDSTYSSGTVTLGTPLANGASINVRFLVGIQQTGNFKYFINIEALP